MKKLKDKIQNSQSKGSGEKSHHIYETYKNTVIPHGHHIYAKASDMVNATICTYPKSDHALPNWKCVLRCCSDCDCINIHDQETDNQYSDTTPSIRFHIYPIIVCCTDYGGIPLKDKNYILCQVCHSVTQL